MIGQIATGLGMLALGAMVVGFFVWLIQPDSARMQSTGARHIEAGHMISYFRQSLFEWLLTCRLFEWVTTFIMLGVAATVVVSPSSLERGAFRWMLVVGFTPLVLGLFLGVVGAARCVALYVNGRSCLWGPRLRAIGALGGAFIWVWMGLALIYLTNDTGTLSLGIFNWFGLALGEMVSCARAGSDVRAKPVY